MQKSVLGMLYKWVCTVQGAYIWSLSFCICCRVPWIFHCQTVSYFWFFFLCAHNIFLHCSPLENHILFIFNIFFYSFSFLFNFFPSQKWRAKHIPVWFRLLYNTSSWWHQPLFCPDLGPDLCFLTPCTGPGSVENCKLSFSFVPW